MSRSSSGPSAKKIDRFSLAMSGSAVPPTAGSVIPGFGSEDAPTADENVFDVVLRGLASTSGNDLSKNNRAVPESAARPVLMPCDVPETLSHVKQENMLLEGSISVYESESFYAESEATSTSFSRNFMTCTTFTHRDDSGRPCFLKTLIPLNLAGSIIGRGGNIMDYIRDATGVQVRMSKATECYPSSMHRVCALSGTPKAVEKAICIIVKQLADRCRGAVSSDDDTTIADGDLTADQEEMSCEMTFLVPDTTASIFIGRGGETIHMLKSSPLNGHVSVATKKHPMTTIEERRINCHGPFAFVMMVVRAIIDALCQDPNHACFPHHVYNSDDNTFLRSDGTGCSTVRPGPSMDQLVPSTGRLDPSTDRPDPLAGLQLALSLTQGVKNIISDEMFEAIRGQVYKASGGSLSTTMEVLANLSVLSSSGLLHLVPAGTAAVKDALLLPMLNESVCGYVSHGRGVGSIGNIGGAHPRALRSEDVRSREHIAERTVDSFGRQSNRWGAQQHCEPPLFAGTSIGFLGGASSGNVRREPPPGSDIQSDGVGSVAGDDSELDWDTESIIEM